MTSDGVEQAYRTARDASRAYVAASRQVRKTDGDPGALHALQVTKDRAALVWANFREAVEAALAAEQE